MSDIKRIHAGLIILRGGGLEKVANKPMGIGGGLKALWGAAKGGSAEAGRLATPVIGETLGKVVGRAPEVAAAYGAYKGYKSDTGQKLKYKYQLWKAQRRQRKMQQQGGY